MDDRETSDSPTDSQREEELQMDAPPPRGTVSPFSKLGAMMRIRNKYQALKRRRLEQGGGASAMGRPSLRSTSPEVFTFDPALAEANAVPPHRRLKKKRKSRVLFPNDSRKFLPVAERSRAKPFLILLSVIVFLQVYNAIENLDDHVLRYDLESLEKTLRREVFGQQAAMTNLLEHLYDYLSTYAHNKPLAVSLNGPTGVGKSHLGRILARHFHSVVGEQLVVQYFAMHHCPLGEEAGQCARDLLSRVGEVVTQAEAEEKIPILIFDEVEHMHQGLLDTLHGLLQPGQNNEYLNAVYLLISSLGDAQITKHVLQNSSSTSRGQLGRDLGPLLRRSLEKHHPLWAEVDIVPLSLLEKSHVMDCFLDEMTREGFYPDRPHIERLAEEISYYSAEGVQFSQNGCKQVVAKVNLL